MTARPLSCNGIKLSGRLSLRGVGRRSNIQQNKDCFAARNDSEALVIARNAATKQSPLRARIASLLAMTVRSLSLRGTDDEAISNKTRIASLLAMTVRSLSCNGIKLSGRLSLRGTDDEAISNKTRIASLLAMTVRSLSCNGIKLSGRLSLRGVGRRRNLRFRQGLLRCSQ